MQTMQTQPPQLTGKDELREKALQLLRKKSDLRAHVLAYVLVNAFLVGIWAVTGAGFFWPVFPIMGWGIGLAFNVWDVYRHAVPTEEQVRREMEAIRRREG